jgi:hypothetical protein
MGMWLRKRRTGASGAVGCGSNSEPIAGNVPLVSAPLQVIPKRGTSR